MCFMYSDNHYTLFILSLVNSWLVRVLFVASCVVQIISLDFGSKTAKSKTGYGIEHIWVVRAYKWVQMGTPCIQMGTDGY